MGFKWNQSVENYKCNHAGMNCSETYESKWFTIASSTIAFKLN